MRDPDFARLKWRCRRGMRELDVLLLSYVDGRYVDSPVGEQAAFRRLLSLPDPEILALLTGRSVTDDAELSDVIQRLLERSQHLRPPSH